MILNSLRFNLFKYDPYKYAYPIINTYYMTLGGKKKSILLEMVLDFLIDFHNNIDLSFSFRRSCREGICGSCAMNINNINSLACTNKLFWNNNIENININIFPLPHMTIIKDLVISMDTFFEQYKYIMPYLYQKYVQKNRLKLEFILNKPRAENKQTKFNRFLLDGIYECILCACCSSSCPSYWWNKELYLGPAILLQAYRWIIDNRDDLLFERLFLLNDIYKLYRCHLILHCTEVCPKNLNPANAITSIQLLTIKNIEK